MNAQSTASEEDAKLEAFFKESLESRFEREPTLATGLGDHRFDHLLDDISKASREQWLEEDEQTLRELPRRVDYKKLSRAGQIDHKMHCQNMTDEAALKLLTEGAFQSEGEARLKIVRSKQSSVHLL